MAKETTTTLRIAGWNCANCSGATRAAIQKMPGVTSATPDLPKGTLAVTFDADAVTVAELEKTVTRLGYRVVHE